MNRELAFKKLDDKTKTPVLQSLEGNYMTDIISEVNVDGWKIDGCQMPFDIDSGVFHRLVGWAAVELCRGP